MNKELYHQIKTLIGRLETELEMVDRDKLTPAEQSDLTKKVETMFNVVCKRSVKRGPYARREAQAA